MTKDDGAIASGAQAERKTLLSVKDTAEYLRVSSVWLLQQRKRGSGPPYLKVGRAFYYDLPDLNAWLDTQKTGAVRRVKL